jgi:hypothetical protein
MRMETFIRKALRLKAHKVVTVEEDEAVGELTIHLDRVGQRRLRCGVCGLEARRVAGTRRPQRRWRDLPRRCSAAREDQDRLHRVRRRVDKVSVNWMAAPSDPLARGEAKGDRGGG